jgi:hypothetical protein
MNAPIDLWAITSYFNPARYRRRLANYRVFRRHLQLPLVAVELSFGADFDLRPEDADVLVQLHGNDVMWQKERLLNIALGASPSECRKVVWIDCDVIAGSADWPERLSRALDEFPVVQPFSRVAYLARDAELQDDGSAGEVEFCRPSAAHLTENGRPAADSLTHLGRSIEQCGSRGMVWAGRRELLDRHGFYDASIVGNGDLAIACAAYGCFDVVIEQQGMNDRQRAHYLAWAQPFFQDVRAAVTSVDSPLWHLWHGVIANRRYHERLKDVQPFQFDPFCDIALADNQVWRWSSDKPLLHQYVKDYFAARKEDG